MGAPDHMREAGSLATVQVVLLLVLAAYSATLDPTSASASQTKPWVDIGPTGGAIGAIAVDPFNPSVVFAGSDEAGLFRSTDQGNTWTRATGIPDYDVHSITPDPSSKNTIFAATFEWGFYVSTDDGVSWSPYQVCGSQGAIKLVIDPSDSKIRYAVCQFSVYISQDGGATWTTSPGVSGITDLEVSQSTGLVYAFTPSSIGGPELLKSADRGGSWTTSSVPNIAPGFGWPDSAQGLAINPTNDNIMLIDANNSTLGTSDGGKSWHEVVLDSKVGIDLDFVSFQSSTVAYAGRALVYRSTDGGASFSKTSLNTFNGTVYSPHPDTGAFAYDSVNNRIYVGTDGGIYVSTDNGASWTWLNRGLSNGLIYGVGTDPFEQGNSIVTRQDWGPLISSDGGGSWRFVASPGATGSGQINPLEGGSVIFDPVHQGVVYLAPGSCSGGNGVAKSSDHGSTFQLLCDGTHGLPTSLVGTPRTLAMDPQDSSTVWVSYLVGGVFKSTDGGSHWTQEASFPASDIAVNGNLAFADQISGSNYTLERSADGGRTWSSTGFISNILPITAAVDPADSSVVYVAYSSRYSGVQGFGNSPGGQGLYASTDGGVTFHEIQIPSDVLSSYRSGTLLVQRIGSTTRILLGSYSPFIFGSGPANFYQTVDGGNTWQPITGNLNVTDVYQFVPDPSAPDRIFVATFGEGVAVGTIVPGVSYGGIVTSSPFSTQTTTATTSSTTPSPTASTSATTTSLTSQNTSSTTTSTTSSGSSSAQTTSTTTTVQVPEFVISSAPMTLAVALATALTIVARRFRGSHGETGRMAPRRTGKAKREGHGNRPARLRKWVRAGSREP